MNERNDIPLGKTYDSFCNLLTVRRGDGFWIKFTRDSFGNELTYQNYHGFWSVFTRDSSGRILTYKTDDLFHVYITHDGYYGLRYEDGRYVAGCRNFSYEEAVHHWNMRSLSTADYIQHRAKLFLDAIEKHEAYLKSVV